MREQWAQKVFLAGTPERRRTPRAGNAQHNSTGDQRLAGATYIGNELLWLWQQVAEEVSKTAERTPLISNDHHESSRIYLSSSSVQKN